MVVGVVVLYYRKEKNGSSYKRELSIKL